MKNVLVYGGDLRSVYMAEYIGSLGYEVTLGGHEVAIDGKEFQSDVIILGLPAVKNGMVYAPRSKEMLSFEEFLKLCRRGSFVAGGKFSDANKDLACQYGVRLFDYARDEIFQVENAFYTAEGAVSVLISNTGRSLREQKVLVAGYGRISRALCSMLMSLGCSVSVYARNPVARAWCQSRGIKALDDLENMGLYDAVINTVPADIFTCEVLSTVKGEAVVMDLSAAPGYVDKDVCAHLGIKLIYLPGLPLSSAPCSAGEAAARAVLARVSTEGK